jgi:hypothetical protein
MAAAASEFGNKLDSVRGGYLDGHRGGLGFCAQTLLQILRSRSGTNLPFSRYVKFGSYRGLICRAA